jgi:hypothetical protein
MRKGDIVRIKEEKEVMVVTEMWTGTSDQVSVLRSGRVQYLPVHLLEVISETN